MLRVGGQPTAGWNRLMHADFAGSAGPDRWIGLRYLGGNLACECWEVDGPVDAGQSGDIDWYRSGDLLVMRFEATDDGSGNAAEAAFTAYEELLRLASRLGHRHLLRCWNFLPQINAGRGDRERYRQFCMGRGQALEAAGFGDEELCAGTAIGSDDPAFRVAVLCSTCPGINIENPRQVSAYRYPRRYGPRSPSFARATAVEQGGDSALLMISGTASVVGHETLHAGDLEAQLAEIVANINVLLDESAGRLDCPGLARLGPGSLMRAYVRHPRDWPTVESALLGAWPDIGLAGLRGDICRSDLLVEVEVVTGA